jgi:hypothetical protein
MMILHHPMIRKALPGRSILPAGGQLNIDDFPSEAAPSCVSPSPSLFPFPVFSKDWTSRIASSARNPLE